MICLHIGYGQSYTPYVDDIIMLTRRSATGNCEWRTCSKSLRGGYRVGFEPAILRTCHWVITPNKLLNCSYVNIGFCEHVQMSYTYLCLLVKYKHTWTVTTAVYKKHKIN